MLHMLHDYYTHVLQGVPIYNGVLLYRGSYRHSLHTEKCPRGDETFARTEVRRNSFRAASLLRGGSRGYPAIFGPRGYPTILGTRSYQTIQ